MDVFLRGSLEFCRLEEAIEYEVSPITEYYVCISFIKVKCSFYADEFYVDLNYLNDCIMHIKGSTVERCPL